MMKNQMIKNTLKMLILFLPVLLLTNCFDILDKVYVKADGSGEYSLIVNASKSKTRLASIAKMETVNGKKVPKKSEIEAELNEAARVFRTVPGISNVKTSADFDNYIIKLSCSFKKIENINAGLALLKSKKIIGKMIPTELYSAVPAKSFSRNKINTFKIDYEKMSSADREVFTNARYTSVLQFDNTVKSQTNSTYKLSPNRKALKTEGLITDVILQKKQIQNTILLQ